MERHLKPGDCILLAVLGAALALGLVWLGISYANGRKTSANGLLVVTQTRDGSHYINSLDGDTTYTVKTPGTGAGKDADGGFNTVRIHDGSVDVKSSNCSNQICVEHDPISAAGEQIVCLPHGMVVEVVADEADATALQ